MQMTGGGSSVGDERCAINYIFISLLARCKSDAEFPTCLRNARRVAARASFFCLRAICLATVECEFRTILV